MDPSSRQWQALLGLSLLALYALAGAGEAPKSESKPASPKSAPAKTEPKAEPKEEPKVEPMPMGPEGQQAVAKVDDRTITRAELTIARRQVVAQNPSGLVPSDNQILDQIIDNVLWQRYAEKQGLLPTKEEVAAAMQRNEEEFRKRGTTTDQILRSNGIPMELYAAKISRELTERRLFENEAQKITPAQVKAQYDAHLEYYDGSRIRLSLISVAPGTDPKSEEKAKERIEKYYGELKAGKDFETLAKNYSEDRSAPAGGDIGWHIRKGDIDETAIKAAWPLKVGEFTEPLHNPMGWHIIKVTDRRGALLTFLGCEDGITRSLVVGHLSAIIEDLRKKAKIEKML